MLGADEIEDEIARIGADRVSGATALVLRGIAVLRAVDPADPHARRRIAQALCRAQPSMAGFRTAAALAAAEENPAEALAGLASRIRRAPAAIARCAVPYLRLRRSAGPLRIVTCSRSTAVEATLIELGRAEALHVACSESLPAREGLDLAERIAETGAIVEVYTDAGVGVALSVADALVVGADAVSTAGFINKVGTAALAALARFRGVPVVVLAGRDKIVPADVFDALPLAAGTAALPAVPANCVFRSPLFERIPAELPADLITDGGYTALESCDPASLWSQELRAKYLSDICAGNMLDMS